jgi:hypothetical protein
MTNISSEGAVLEKGRTVGFFCVNCILRQIHTHKRNRTGRSFISPSQFCPNYISSFAFFSVGLNSMEWEIHIQFIWKPGHAIAQAVSLRFSTAAGRVRSQVRSCARGKVIKTGSKETDFIVWAEFDSNETQLRAHVNTNGLMNFLVA